MKLGNIVGITALVVLGGCARADNLNSWQGHSAQELISAMGEPSQTVRIQDGSEENSYRHDLQRNRTGGVQTGGLGRGTPLAAPGGASTLFCTVIFRTDLQGTIVSANTEGNFDACNDYLGTVAAAQ